MKKNKEITSSESQNKKYKRILLTVVCLITLAGCGSASGKSASSPDNMSPAGEALFSDNTPLPESALASGVTLSQGGVLSSDDTPSPGDSFSPGDSLSPEDSLSPGDSLSSEDSPSPGDSLSSGDPLSPEELADTAYSSLLSGDNSLLDEESLRMWHLEDWSDFLQSGFIYEYTYLDLDGDGFAELLIQMEDAPLIYNAVFHYADGRLFCWNNDTVEMTGGNYPLQNGTMVSEYHFNDTCSYTIFRYLPNGGYETLSSLYARESLTDEDSDEPCPYYTIDGQEVDQATFEAQLEEAIMNQLLPRSAWTIL